MGNLIGRYLKAARVYRDVAEVAVSKASFLPHGDVDGVGQGHKRSGGRDLESEFGDRKRLEKGIR